MRCNVSKGVGICAVDCSLATTCIRSGVGHGQGVMDEESLKMIKSAR